MNQSAANTHRYDVVIIGGALSGAATALMLLRERPTLRVLVVEKSPAFGRRVGEATIEVSTYFLTHVLGLTQHLNEFQLNKHGLRFWFANESTRELGEASEIGGRYWSRVPAYLVDRATLDEEVLRRAVAAGAELWRPASVGKVQLVSGGDQILELRRGESTETIHARWVVDASGVAAQLARSNGWWQPNLDHPTTAVWSRWRGVKDWDGLELAAKHPEWAAACFGQRSVATNHLMGDGWWAWMIALKGGDVSVGVVFDQRLVQWPEGGALAQRLKDFLCAHPVGRAFLSDAQWTDGDVHWRKNLPYYSTTFAGDGFMLVGDAAGFLDPLYSPGLDWVTYTTVIATQLILAQQSGQAIAPTVARINHDLATSYRRWFNAIYREKYEYIGDYELLRTGFLLDLGLYYLGVASQPYRRGFKALLEPYFSTGPSVPFYHLMRTYNRRFAAIARNRRARGCFGRKNSGQRFMFGGYTFAPNSARHIVKALVWWLRIELTDGWRTWFRPAKPSMESSPAPLAAVPATKG